MLPIAKSILAQFGLDWQLPGHGSAYTNLPKGSNCGDWRYRGCLRVDLHTQDLLLGDEDALQLQKVSGKVAIEFYHRNCGRAECPVCYERWCALEAHKIENRLKPFWKHGKVLHVAISPSEYDVLTLPFEKLRAKMYRVAKLRGVLGGCSIIHPWRENEDGTWRVSPHFHILGFGWVKNTKEGYEKDGWLVINIQDGEKERSVYRTALYQLSHCGLSDDHRTVTWFGCCSYAQRDVKVPPMEKLEHKCPCCQNDLLEVRYVGHLDQLPDLEEGVWWLCPDDWVECARPSWRG
jgi:hypothetical protein